jgi:hypothetical protein
MASWSANQNQAFRVYVYLTRLIPADQKTRAEARTGCYPHKPRFPFAFLLLRRWFGIMRDFAGQALRGLATRLSNFGIKAFQSHSDFVGIQSLACFAFIFRLDNINTHFSSPKYPRSGQNF